MLPNSQLPVPPLPHMYCVCFLPGIQHNFACPKQEDYKNSKQDCTRTEGPGNGRSHFSQSRIEGPKTQSDPPPILAITFAWWGWGEVVIQLELINLACSFQRKPPYSKGVSTFSNAQKGMGWWNCPAFTHWWHNWRWWLGQVAERQHTGGPFKTLTASRWWQQQQEKEVVAAAGGGGSSGVDYTTTTVPQQLQSVA